MSYARAPGPGLFSSGEASAITGVSQRTIDYWSKIRLVRASIECHGTGSDRWYNFEDLVVLYAIRQSPMDAVHAKLSIVRALRDQSRAEIVEVSLSPLLTVFINVARVREQVTSALDRPRAIKRKKG
jgi:DNA-binding transcriptional MerR regulator